MRERWRARNERVVVAARRLELLQFNNISASGRQDVVRRVHRSVEFIAHLRFTAFEPVPRAEIYVKDIMVTSDPPEKAFVAP